MIVNPDKFQAILQNSRNLKNCELVKLEIGSAKIEIKNTVKPLGITIDNKLNCEEHISELCKKASTQLNAISLLQRFRCLRIIYNNYPSGYQTLLKLSRRWK